MTIAPAPLARADRPPAVASRRSSTAIVQQAPGRAGGRASPSSRRSCSPGVFVVLYAITAWKDDSLLTASGVRSVLLLACPLAIFAASQTLCMLTGGIDLSIAMTANLAAYVAANESDRGRGRRAGDGARRRARRRRRQRPGHRCVQGQPVDHDARHGERAAGCRHRRPPRLAVGVDERARRRARRRLGHARRAAAEERHRLGGGRRSCSCSGCDRRGSAG